MAMPFRHARFFVRVVEELAKKHTKALLGGFFLGIVGSTLLFRLTPYIQARVFAPIVRTAVIGEFTPTTLPISIQRYISRGLTKINDDGSVLPDIATSWEATTSGSGVVYTIRLEQNILWHDGINLTAKDINYNIKNVLLTPIDAYTLQAKLNEPYTPFPSLLSKPLLRPGLVGIGDYKVDSIRLRGDAIRYLRLSDANRKNLPAREYRFYLTEAQAELAYKLGEIDRIENLDRPDTLEQWQNTTIIEKVHYDRIVALFFNLKDTLLSEKSVRQLLAFSLPELDQERALSPISKTSWAYTDNVKRYSATSEQQSKLFKPSPLATGSGQLTISTFASYAGIAEKIIDSWKRLGIQVNIRIENSVPHDYQILLSAQSLPPDPDLYPFWHSTQTSGNITGYMNVKIDKLLEDGRREQDPEKRKKIYTDFQRRLVDDAPAVFLYYPKTYDVERTHK